MLKKEQISKIKIYSEEWHMFRAGRMTSSKAFNLVYPTGFTDGTMSYIYQKVGEKIQKQPLDFNEQIEDENTSHGIQYEPEALDLFKRIMKVNYMTNQNIIYDLELPFSSTPDAIWTHNESINQLEYNVSTIEVKCPRTHHNYIPLWECDTPEKLKKFKPRYYWQVIDQMDLCDSQVGYFMCYQPFYPAKSNHRIIEFMKINLWNDFKLLKERKKKAVDEFKRLYNSLADN